MNTHDIAAFVAVVDTGSISAAAGKLHLTQSGISRRVQSLEGQLNLELLDRDSKPLRPTAAGRDVYERGRRVLATLDDLLAVGAHEGEVSGGLRLGVPSSLAEHALAGPIDVLRRNFPRVTPRVSAAWSPALLQMVLEGRIDVGAILTPDHQAPPDTVASHFLGRQMPVLVASTELRLPMRPLKLAELVRHPWVLNQDGCGMRRAIGAALDAAKLPFEVAAEAFGAELQLSLVARGMGIGIVAPGALARSAYRTQVQVLDVPEFNTGVNAWVIHAKVPGRLAAPIAGFCEALAAVLVKDGRLEF
jgi:DNA-binding transcriptional LysR family regulator